MISAKVIADSKNLVGNRITTMVVTMPRIVLAEFNTHRVFSRNSASSRAIPFKKMVKSVEENPFIPIAWQRDHKGMQGTEYVTDENSIILLKNNWLSARNNAVRVATMLHDKGITKQLCNRLLEPFMWHTVIVTSTEWENFFKLRCPQYGILSEQIPMEFRSKKDLIKYAHEVEASEFKDQYDNLSKWHWLQANKSQAEIHIQALAECMWDALNESVPKELKLGEWHIPFGDEIDLELSKIVSPERREFLINQKIKIATAMCARISYTVVGEEGKEPNYENDIILHDRLFESGHWSPFEHCARSAPGIWRIPNLCGNFKGFFQYRHLINYESKKTESI